MTVAMPNDGGAQQQVVDLDELKRVARDEQKQKREEHGQKPTLAGGYRSNCPTPDWNDVYGKVPALSQLGQPLQKRETSGNESYVSGEGESVF